MDESKRYWFRRKRYGLGWAPVTWQGWLALALYVASLVAARLWLFERGDRLPFAVCVLASTAALVAVCWWKGEPPTLRWGGDE